MNLSKETLTVLKNFATINGNLLITPGNYIKTLSGAKSVFASAKIQEEFPQEFGIYDLNEFLGALSICNDPTLTFTDKFVKIEGQGSFKFYSADKEVLTYPNKDIKMPDIFVEFDVSSDDLQMIQKTAGIIGAQDVVFQGDGSTIKVIVTDKKNSTSNSFEREIGTTDKTFDVYLKQENMKFIVDDYTVSISDKKIANLVGSQVEYFVSLESDSKFS